MPSRIRFGWNFPGTFTRLGLHMGAILAWFFYKLPIDSLVLVVATSAGAIIMACCISLEKKVLHRVASIVGNLKRQQIFRLSSGLYHTGAHLLAAPCMLVVAYIIGGFLHGWWAALSLVTGLALFVWLIRRAIKVFFESKSPLDNSPLRELFTAERVAQMAFLAEKELRIVAADVATPGPVVISNHDSRRSDPKNPLHCERFENAILGTSDLPGRFGFHSVDGIVLRDAEVWTDFPIKQFKGECDVVFRFDYWEPLQPALAPTHWLGDLFRCFDVMRDKNTRDKMAKYELERKSDPSLPKVIYIRASEKLLRQIPELAVYDFKPKQLWRSIRLGYRIIKENLPMIRKELGLDQEGGLI